MGLIGVDAVMRDTKNGTALVYQEGRARHMRGKDFKVTYMGNNKNQELKQGAEHLLNIDGEFWGFKDYVTIETLPNEVETLCDVNYYFNDYMKCFKN